MCRPSCCNNSSREGAGITAIAVIATGAIVAVKIGPIVARIIHLIVEVLTIIMVTAASALVCIVLAWLTVRILRWQLRRHNAHQQTALRPVPSAVRITEGDSGLGCLACGDSGQVLRAISGSKYQAQPCPACEPATRAG
jgi:hypothetical protein